MTTIKPKSTMLTQISEMVTWCSGELRQWHQHQGCDGQGRRWWWKFCQWWELQWKLIGSVLICE